MIRVSQNGLKTRVTQRNMPGISVSKICVPFGAGGTDWSAYWSTLISATVENAAPTDVVLTFPAAQTSLTDADFTIAGFTIASGSWTGAVLTLVLSSAVLVFDGNLIITFVTTGGTATVTNNVADDGNTVAWYDSTDLTTITKDGANLVSRWNDKLGSGHDLIQATGTKQPTLGANGVSFGGSDEFMATADFGLTYPCSVYIIFRFKSYGYFDSLITGLVNNSCHIQQVVNNTTLRLAGLEASNCYVLNTNYILRGFFKVNPATLKINDAVYSGDPVTLANPLGIMVGANYNGTANFGDCDILHLIYRSGTDSPAIDTAIYNYLKKK